MKRRGRSGSHQRLVSAVSRRCRTRTWGRGQEAFWPLCEEELGVLSLFCSQVKPSSCQELFWDSPNAIRRHVRVCVPNVAIISGDWKQIRVYLQFFSTI